MEINAGLATQIRELKKRLDALDLSKADPKEARDMAEALSALETRLEKQRENKLKRKQDKETAESKPAEQEKEADKNLSPLKREELYSEKKADNPGDYLYKCKKCDKGFDQPAEITGKPEYAGGKAWPEDVSPCCGAGYTDNDPIVVPELEVKPAPKVSLPDLKDIKLPSEVDKESSVGKFAVDSFVEPARGTPGSKGRVIRHDPNDLVYVLWEEGKLKDSHGFGAYEPKDLKAYSSVKEASIYKTCPKCEDGEMFENALHKGQWHCPNCGYIEGETKNKEASMKTVYALFPNGKKETVERFMDDAHEYTSNVYANHVQGQYEVHLEMTSDFVHDLKQLAEHYGGHLLNSKEAAIHPGRHMHKCEDCQERFVCPLYADCKDTHLDIVPGEKCAQCLEKKGMDYFQKEASFTCPLCHHSGKPSGMMVDGKQVCVRCAADIDKEAEGTECLNVVDQTPPQEGDPSEKNTGYGGDRPGVWVGPADAATSLTSSLKFSSINQSWAAQPLFEKVAGKEALSFKGYDVYDNKNQKVLFIKTSQRMSKEQLEGILLKELSQKGLIHASLKDNFGLMRKGSLVRVSDFNPATGKVRFASLGGSSVSGVADLAKFSTYAVGAEGDRKEKHEDHEDTIIMHDMDQGTALLWCPKAEDFIHKKITELTAELEKDAYIVEEHGKFCVKSPKNPKWNGGCFDSRGAAEHRLKQVEWFRDHKGSFVRSPEGKIYKITDLNFETNMVRIDELS